MKSIIMKNKNQKGVALITVFFIVTILLAIVLGVNAILFNKVKLIGNVDKSLYAFDAAYGGTEKALYYKSNDNLCNLCSNCPTDASDASGEFAAHCNNCTATPLQTNGCNANACNNCSIYFDAAWDGNEHRVTATVTPTETTIQSIGAFDGVSRQMTVKITSGNDSAP